MQFQLRVPEGFRGRIYTHKVTNGNNSQEAEINISNCSQHYGRSQCFVRGNGGNTYTLRIPGVSGFPDCGTEKVGSVHCNIEKRVISSAGQFNLIPVVIPARKQHCIFTKGGGLCLLSPTLIAHFLHRSIELVTVMSTYLLVWRHDHQHSGGAVQSGHPDAAGHEVQPDLHNAGTRQCRGHQRISGHRVSHKLQTNPFPLLTLIYK